MKFGKILGFGMAGILIHSIFPTIYNKYLNANVVKKLSKNNSIMLTFDDGPDPRYTGKLLDLLKKYKVHAIFFIVIENAKENESLIDRMISEGHTVGFHSLQHKNPMLISYWKTKKEFKEGYKFLKRKGVSQIYYRPPWGQTNIFTNYFVEKYNMKLMLWTVMAEDWSKQATVTSILSKCRQRIENHSIICLHDSGDKSGGACGAPYKTIRALEVLIPELLELGYLFELPRKGATYGTKSKNQRKADHNKCSNHGFINGNNVLSIIKG